MEYAGGTYISQVKASSPKSASVKWAQHIDVNQVRGLGEKSKLMLIKEIKNRNPTPINDVLNTWCVWLDIRGKSALVNFVQTEL